MGGAWNGRVSEAGTADLEEGEEGVREGEGQASGVLQSPHGVGIDPCLLPSVLPPTSCLFPYGFCFFVISAAQNQPSLSGGLPSSHLPSVPPKAPPTPQQGIYLCTCPCQPDLQPPLGLQLGSPCLTPDTAPALDNICLTKQPPAGEEYGPSGQPPIS